MGNTRSKTKKTCNSQAHSDHQSTQPEALVGSNDDLLTDILLRLPATSILRFKSVSKHWRWLLSHQHFTHRYDNLSKSPGLLLGDIYIPFDTESPSTRPYSSLEFYIKRPHVTIIQHCNGLLLCRGFFQNDVKYYVFNPTTKQLATIPSIIGGYTARRTIDFMGLAFHRTDPVCFEIVCIRALVPHGNKFQIQIYSSFTKRWRVSIECSSGIVPAFGNVVYWNGAIHWASYIYPCNYWYFKTDGELLQKLPSPEGMVSSEIRTTYFGESRGHLHLIVYKILEGSPSLHMNVYEMLRDYSKWFVKYQVQLDELPVAFPEIIYPSGRYNFKVVDVVRGEEEEDTFMVLRSNIKIITYNVHHKSFKHIFSFPCILFEDFVRSYRYTETLTSF